MLLTEIPFLFPGHCILFFPLIGHLLHLHLSHSNAKMKVVYSYEPLPI